MKGLYKVLVLTDHSGHSVHNSLYAILTQLRLHRQCDSIYVASRGVAQNASFFQDMEAEKLQACLVEEGFEYTEAGDHFKTNLKKVDVTDYNLVLMRLPRPVSDEFLSWLNHIFSHSVIINNPEGIIKTSTKEFLLNFPDLCPHIRLCRSVEDIREEIAKFPIVLKPLKEYGGRGLLKMDESTVDDGNEEYDLEVFLEAMQEDFEEEGYLSMKFLKNVDQGDKRILVVGDEILAASLRIPAKDSWLCNVAQGGKSIAADITEEERDIVKAISPGLMKEGVLIYGVDTLVNDNGLRTLSEINTLSIGGFPQAERQTGKPVIKMLIDKIFEYADARKR